MDEGRHRPDARCPPPACRSCPRIGQEVILAGFGGPNPTGASIVASGQRTAAQQSAIDRAAGANLTSGELNAQKQAQSQAGRMGGADPRAAGPSFGGATGGVSEPAVKPPPPNPTLMPPTAAP